MTGKLTAIIKNKDIFQQAYQQNGHTRKKKITKLKVIINIQARRTDNQ